MCQIAVSIFSYYCDVCRSLQELDANGKVKSSSTAQQFNNIRCPTKPGFYQMQREFCFNDFSEFDKNHDCQPDFLEKKTPGAENYQNAMKNLEQMGYVSIF